MTTTIRMLLERVSVMLMMRGARDDDVADEIMLTHPKCR